MSDKCTYKYIGNLKLVISSINVDDHYREESSLKRDARIWRPVATDVQGLSESFFGGRKKNKKHCRRSFFLYSFLWYETGLRSVTSDTCIYISIYLYFLSLFEVEGTCMYLRIQAYLAEIAILLHSSNCASSSFYTHTDTIRATLQTNKLKSIESFEKLVERLLVHRYIFL